MAELPKGAELLAAAARKMRAEFAYARGANPHPSEKGREFERILIRFLNSHLPARFRATRGFIVDDSGGMSPHTDVIVYDQLSAFVFPADEDNLIVPNDNVASVIEVKTTLSKATLQDAAEKMGDVKALQKRAAESEDEFVVSTTRGLLFAYETAISPEVAWGHLKELNASRHSDLWLDEIVVLDAWQISYAIQPPHLDVQGMYGGKAAREISVPALYVIPVLAQRGEFTLSEFMVRLAAHLNFYQQAPGRPFSFFMKQGEENRTLGGYWFGTDGALKEVPPGQFSPIAPPARFEIREKNGVRIGMIEWFPWADGHVICFLGFEAGIPPPIEAWFLQPYGRVILSSPSPRLRITDVKPGSVAPHFGRSLRFFEESISPWTASPTSANPPTGHLPNTSS